MCGIVGWVDFARDVRRDEATLRAMTATMALRGPDGEGFWLDEHVALGHRRLAVIDPPTGAQPLTACQHGEVAAALTYTGEIYDFKQVRAELKAAGQAFVTDCDTEVVLRAYLQWGDAFVERLTGMFAFALWDRRQECLLLVRDRMGVKPLYYRTLPDGVVFASEQKGIFAHPDVDCTVELGGLRAMLAGAVEPGDGIYRDLREVLPGEVVRIDRLGTRGSRYWQLRAEEHRDDLPTTVRTVRSLLTDAVAGQLVADVPLGTLLSGGLDSSAITALAAGLRPQLRSVTVDFAGQPDPDRPFATDAAAAFHTTHTEVVLSADALADPRHRVAVLSATGLPNGQGDFDTSLYLLFRAFREHCTVALSGEGADELFGGYRWHHDDSVWAGTFPWLAPGNLVRADPDGPALDLLLPDTPLDLQEYRRAAYERALAEVEHLPGEGRVDRRMREVSHLHLTRLLRVLLDRTDRLSMAHGLEVRVPFCDHRLVGYVHNVPWSTKSAGGRVKGLLRSAVADLLPASVLDRQKSPYPVIQDPAYEVALRAQLMHVLDDASSPVLDLVDRHLAWQLVVSPINGDRYNATRRAIELILNLDIWLRRQPVRLNITN